MVDFHENVMNKIDIRNEDFLELLNRCSDLLTWESVRNLKIQHAEKDAEDYTSDEYLKGVQEQWKGHDGFPQAAKSMSLSIGDFKSGSLDGDIELTKTVNQLTEDLMNYLGVRNKALFMVYPPGGFIDWHNNANAPGYNVLFTFSEEGKGYWAHIDPVTGEKVVIPDVKGWQCKYGYYGTYDEPDKLLYHCAATECWRMTVAFIYNTHENGQQMAQMMLEDISSVV